MAAKCTTQYFPLALWIVALWLQFCTVASYYPVYHLTVQTLNKDKQTSDKHETAPTASILKLRFNVTAVTGGFQVGYVGIWLDMHLKDGSKLNIGRCYNTEPTEIVVDDQNHSLTCNITTYNAIADLEMVNPPEDFQPQSVEVGIDDYHYGFVTVEEPYSKIRYDT